MGDDISRKDAIKHFQDLSKQIKSMPITDIITRLKEMPPVTLQPRKGYWEKIELPARDTYKCSVCGELAYGDGVEAEIQLSNFCPNCGADMRGEE